MTITNTDEEQSINAIFRDAVFYTSTNLKLLVTNENTNKTIEYAVDSVQYKANYATISYNVDSADQFKDGEEYLIKILNASNELLFIDKIYVTEVSFDSSKQNIANTDYTFTETNDSDYEYTVINN